jgi:uncharacterized damage-inducible protein DinB
MTEKEIYIKGMESELPLTLKVLRAIPAGQESFKPHERSQTAKQIVETLVGEVGAMKGFLNGEENVFKRPDFSTMEQAIKMYEESFSDLMNTVKAAADEEFQKPTAGMMGKFFPLRIDAMRAFANDTIHHRGQLSVYIRLAGGKVPAIYGPSADENPFQ